jgi:pre-mRNA-processing factor 17
MNTSLIMSLTRYDPSASDASRKRKNVLTGNAEEIVLSDTTFKAQHRTFQSLGYARDPSSGALVGDLTSAASHSGTDAVAFRPSKADSQAWRAKRQKKGDAGTVYGEGAYKGPWCVFLFNNFLLLQ